MEMKDRKKAAETAENRMQMIAPLLAPNLSREDVTKLKESISEQFQVSVRTLERYSKSYLERGFEGLYPQGKSTQSKFKIPKDLLPLPEHPHHYSDSGTGRKGGAGLPEADDFTGRSGPRRIFQFHDEGLPGQGIRLTAFPAPAQA